MARAENPYSLYNYVNCEVYHEGYIASTRLQDPNEFDSMRRHYPHFKTVITQNGKLIYTCLNEIYLPKSSSTLSLQEKQDLFNCSFDGLLDILSSTCEQVDNALRTYVFDDLDGLITQIDLVCDLVFRNIMNLKIKRLHIPLLLTRIEKFASLISTLKAVVPYERYLSLSDIEHNILQHILKQLKQASQEGGKIIFH